MAKPGAATSPLRRLVLVQAKLDYADLEPGAAASDAIHQAARDLKLDAAHGVTVRLTGEVPLSDEEFASLADGAWLVTAVMLAAVGLMLWLATRSVRMMACILGTTLAGLVVTAALGLLVIGRFNLISVAFIPLFVGLGIDFGIQFAVRFRAERLDEPDHVAALGKTAVGIGESLAVAAGAVTLGLFAFLPTSYIGVSELGVIAGMGMVVALGLNLTLLPALLILVKPREREAAIGYASLAPLDHFLVAHRRKVLWALRHRRRGDHRPAAAGAVRLQSAAPAQSQGRGDGDANGPDEGPRADAQHHQCAEPVPDGRRRRWRRGFPPCRRWRARSPSPASCRRGRRPSSPISRTPPCCSTRPSIPSISPRRPPTPRRRRACPRPPRSCARPSPARPTRPPGTPCGWPAPWSA